jgi:hypothetical protein
LTTEKVLGVEKRQERDDEEEYINGFGRHYLMRPLVQFEHACTE